MTSRDSHVAGWTEKAYAIEETLFKKRKRDGKFMSASLQGFNFIIFILYIQNRFVDGVYKYFEPTREIISQAGFIVQEFTENSTFLCWSILIDFISPPWAQAPVFAFKIFLLNHAPEFPRVDKILFLTLNAQQKLFSRGFQSWRVAPMEM